MTISALCVASLLLSTAVSAGSIKSQDSVIQKVVEMLQENKVKVSNDLKAEETEMAEYTQFCDKEIEEKSYAIKTASRKIDDLWASIDDAVAQVKALDDEIAQEGTEMAGKEADMASAAGVRGNQKKDFEETEKSMVSAVDALERAIVLIKRDAGFLQTNGKPTSKDAKKSAKALADILGKVIDAAWVDTASATVVKAFLQDHDQAASSASDDLKFKHQQVSKKEGGGLLSTLEDMKQKAQETLSASRMGEMKDNHNHQMLTQSLTDAIALSKEKISDAKSTKASLTEAKGKAEGELAETKKSKMSDMMYVENLKQECKEAADEWSEKQASGKAEMAAIDKAKEILTSKVKVLVQKDEPYVDGDEDSSPDAAKRHSLVEQLQGLGHKFNSYAMMEMAGAAAQDPFEKIRGLIEDMVAKLTAEANADATQKAFCDEEKAKSQKEKDDKSMRSDELRSRIDSANSAKDKLQEAIKDLQAELSDAAAASAEANKMRTAERATYEKASKDYKDGAQAVEEAIRVLKEYYSSVSLVQLKRAHQGEANSAIISILENSAAEFSRMAMQLDTDEREAVASYEKYVEDSKVSAAAKKSEIQGAESEIKVLTVTLSGDTEDLKMSSKELDAVMEYLEKLKPQCEVKVVTYEEKKAKREAEIEGLKEALSILDAPALVQVHRA